MSWPRSGRFRDNDEGPPLEAEPIGEGSNQAPEPCGCAATSHRADWSARLSARLLKAGLRSNRGTASAGEALLELLELLAEVGRQPLTDEVVVLGDQLDLLAPRLGVD